MINLVALPNDVSDYIWVMALANLQHACARVAHSKSMRLIHEAAVEMDKKRHVIYFTDGQEPATETQYWHNSNLNELLGVSAPSWQDIDYSQEATFESA